MTNRIYFASFPGPLQQSRHVGQQLLAGGTFLAQRLGQHRRVAEAGQVGVLLPVAQRLLYRGMVGGLAGLQLLGAEGLIAERHHRYTAPPGRCRQAGYP
jgi:hypothetical protein